MIDWTIMEYNTQTKKYTFLGYAEAESPKKAKQVFLKDTTWQPTEDTLLFAKPPLCR